MERKEPFDFAKTLFSSMCEIPPAVTGGELLEERMFPGITGPGLNSGNSARALGVKFKCGLASSWLPACAGFVSRDPGSSGISAHGVGSSFGWTPFSDSTAVIARIACCLLRY